MFENFDSSGGWNLTFLKHGVIPAKAGTSSKFVNQNYQVQQQQLLNQQISKLFLCKGYTLVLIIRNAKLMAMIIFFFLLY
jgi:hypothetical protein